MKTDETKPAENTEAEEPKGKKQNTKTTNQSSQTNAQANANAPDWLMHLLTGAGALGGNYLLFIKPLQEKFDAMKQAILLQEKNIEKLQEQLDLLNHKLKKTRSHQNEDEQYFEEDSGQEIKQKSDDLFTMKMKHQKNKPSFTNENKRTVRF
jgi:hypothetical protein